MRKELEVRRQDVDGRGARRNKGGEMYLETRWALPSLSKIWTKDETAEWWGEGGMGVVLLGIQEHSGCHSVRFMVGNVRYFIPASSPFYSFLCLHPAEVFWRRVKCLSAHSRPRVGRWS